MKARTAGARAPNAAPPGWNRAAALKGRLGVTLVYRESVTKQGRAAGSGLPRLAQGAGIGAVLVADVGEVGRGRDCTA